MIYSEVLKRELPEGWRVANLFEACRVQYGFPFSTTYFNEDKLGLPIIRIRDIRENSISNYSTENDIDKKYLIKKGDLLIGMDGNFNINYWTKEDCYLNQRVVKLSETILPIIYIRYQVEPYIKLREKSISRTTVGHLSDKDLRRISIIVPGEKVLQKANKLFDFWLKKIISNQQQNQQLTSLRDWLLPMLMNGQATVTGNAQSVGENSLFAVESRSAFGKPTRLNIPANRKAFAKQVLAAKIIARFKDDPNFTDIKFQKVQFLAEHIIKADLNLNYYYQAAGPYDNIFMHTIYNDLKKNRWYDRKNRKFSALEKHVKIEEYYQGYFGPANGQLDSLFRLLSDATEAKSEIIATIYAVWNNFVIEGRPVVDKELIESFYDWSERKHQYTKEQILESLQWIRGNHLEPTGFGKLIKKARQKP